MNERIRFFDCFAGIGGFYCGAKRIYDERMDCWHPSPAYDLTWSTTYFGEHTTTVDGNGKNPGMKELLAVGKAAGIGPKKCKHIAEEIFEKTADALGKYQNMLS